MLQALPMSQLLALHLLGPVNTTSSQAGPAAISPTGQGPLNGTSK